MPVLKTTCGRETWAGELSPGVVWHTSAGEEKAGRIREVAKEKGEGREGTLAPVCKAG